MKESNTQQIVNAVPTSWLDPMLSGPNAVIGKPPYDCKDIERLLLMVKERIRTKQTDGAWSVAQQTNRLIAKWRQYAKNSKRELGSTIDAVGRAELKQMELTYMVCARELERALKQQTKL